MIFFGWLLLQFSRRYWEYISFICVFRFKVDQFVARYVGAAENAIQAGKKHHGQNMIMESSSTTKPPATKKSKTSK